MAWIYRTAPVVPAAGRQPHEHRKHREVAGQRPALPVRAGPTGGVPTARPTGGAGGASLRPGGCGRVPGC
ncbi:TPA: hypothetical protein QEN11_02285 [Stenotrophomonas maltophilia]|nr:hypothetical protein [Stenotrophomonas maltophilia]